MTNLSDVSAAQLRRAAAIKDQIDKLQRKLSNILGSKGASSAVPTKGRRRKMSAAARAKIGEAQKARWAKMKARKK